MCAIRGRPAARPDRDAAPPAPRCGLDLMGPVQARLGPQRWHFQHGPIDLIIGAHGDDEAVRESLELAWARFATVLFVAGAGGSLRAGVTENPVLLTRSIKDLLVKVTCGGAPAYVWPGGGITVMVDVARMPARSFGWVPTPAIVAPIEFTMRVADYRALGGHVERMRSLADVIAQGHARGEAWDVRNPWPAGGTA